METPTLDAAIIAARTKGKLQREIKEELNVGFDKIFRVLGDADMRRSHANGIRGEAQHSAKLTGPIVRFIRQLHDQDGLTYPAIKAQLKLDVSIVAIHKACKRITWRHIK